MNQIEQEYKAIIIGTGQGGSPLARELANAGWKTAVIESHYVGGSCINFGCTPTKTMVASARVAYLARRAGDYGVSASEISVELKKVKQRKQNIVESFRNSGRRRLETTENLDLYFGRGRFLNSQDIEIKLNSGKKKLIRGKYIVINTGTETFIPDIPGLQSIDHLTSSSIMELEKVPEHLLIMGGGYIGLEFGQMFRRFGSQVTIIQRGSQLLSREDRDVAEEIATILQEDGIQVLLEADIKQVEQLNPSRIILKIHRYGKSEKVEGTHLLVAVGRRPATKYLGLENTGIDLDRRGNIKVNERLETSQEQVYAIGDVKGGPAFTHISYDDYRI
ncbi:MAG: FAD-dependent oxidoreductase, partial [bacterium]